MTQTSIRSLPFAIAALAGLPLALVAQAPHPHAAALLADFLLSAEAAKILGDLDYGSPFKPVSFKLWYPESGLSTEQYDKAAEKWDKLLREIGRKPL